FPVGARQTRLTRPHAFGASRLVTPVGGSRALRRTCPPGRSTASLRVQPTTTGSATHDLSGRTPPARWVVSPVTNPTAAPGPGSCAAVDLSARREYCGPPTHPRDCARSCAAGRERRHP